MGRTLISHSTNTGNIDNLIKMEVETVDSGVMKKPQGFTVAGTKGQMNIWWGDKGMMYKK